MRVGGFEVDSVRDLCGYRPSLGPTAFWYVFLDAIFVGTWVDYQVASRAVVIATSVIAEP